MSTKSQTLTDRKNARRPQLDRDSAMRLAATEYARVADLLERLTPEQWSARTDCPDWDVRAMAGHMLGMVQMVATVPELMRQQLAAARRVKRTGGLQIDTLTAWQVEKNLTLAPDELVSEFRRLSPKAVRNRRRSPAVLRNRTMQEETDGLWTFGYLFDVILTRDPFMHRIDISRATGLSMIVAAEHEGAIVDDVVHEWAQRHGEPYSLELSGPAGGHWQAGDGDRIAMDPFEFCRAVSGRAPAAGLLATQVPF